MKGKSVAVIGAGISGLAAGYRFKETARELAEPLQVSLFESAPRPGGVIQSFYREGIVMEAGAESFITEKAGALDLCRRLGLEDQLISTRSENRKSFLRFRGELHEIPEGFYLMAPTGAASFLRSGIMTMPGKLRALMEPVIPARRNAEPEESLGAFMKRRFGRELSERIGQALTGGIYAGDVDRLSLQSTFPRFAKLEEEYGSVIRGLRKLHRGKHQVDQASGARYGLFASLKGGMQVLVDALERELSGQLRTNHEVAGVERLPHEWLIRFAGGGQEKADALCLALPGYAAARLLEGTCHDLAEALKGIRYESSATVNMIFPRPAVSHLSPGFGYVVSASEASPVLGCTFSGYKYTRRSTNELFLLRVFLGGPRAEGIINRGEASVAEAARAEARKHLKIPVDPCFVKVSVYKKAMPQYELGHQARLKKIEGCRRPYPSLRLTGNAYGGIGVPDCISHAESAADALTAFLREEPTRASL